MNKNAIVGPLEDVWLQMAGVIPMILGGLAILIIGLLASSILSHAARKLIEALKIDDMVQGFSVFRKAQSAGWKLRPSHIFGNIVKWFFIIVTLIAVADYLNLEAISTFLSQVVDYIPRVVVAMVVLAVGFILGQFVHDIVKQSLASSQMSEEAGRFAPLVAKYAIIILAGMTAATELKIGDELINTFFTAVMAALAIGLGLAFGLGGKEHASRILDRVTRK